MVNCSCAATDVAGIESSGDTEVSGASELAVTLEVSGETDEFEPQAPRSNVTVHRAAMRENDFMIERYYGLQINFSTSSLFVIWR